MKKYHIKVSWFDRDDDENKSSLVEDVVTHKPLVCTLEQGKENLVAIKENIELEAKVSNLPTLERQTQYEIIKSYREKSWFCFDSFPAVLNEKGELAYAIDRSDIANAILRMGKIISYFYRPDFHNIYLLGEGGKTQCDTFWHGERQCSSYSAELVEVTEKEEGIKINW